MKIKRKLSLFEVILIVAIFAICVAILFPTPLHEGRGAPMSSTYSNAKQLTFAILIYASDYDEKPPFVHPFEFGDDPLETYIKNGEIHSIRYPPHSEGRKRGTTDFRFQYVLNRKTIKNGNPLRLILGPILEDKDYSQTIVLTGNVKNWEGIEFIVAGFADGPVRKYEKSQLKAVVPPRGDFPNLNLNLNELRYALKEETKPPEFWEVPYEDVERYEKWARGRRK